MEAATQDPPPAPADSPLKGLAGPLLQYLEARGVLLSIEAREVFLQIVRVTVLAGITAFSAFTGWLLLNAALLSVLMDRFDWTWQKAACILGAGHFLLALLSFAVVRSRLTAVQWFADTLNEFKKDRAWLARQTQKP